MDPELPKDFTPTELQDQPHSPEDKDSNGTVNDREHGTESSTKRNLSEPPRDPRDHTTTPVVSRPASPYTLNPPIDFDGLSWPCEFYSYLYILVC